MNKDQLIAAARSFEIKPGEIPAFPILVEACRQADGSLKWAVRQRTQWCLSKSGEWDFEPIPSARTNQWLTDHRWNDRKDAIKAAQECTP